MIQLSTQSTVIQAEQGTSNSLAESVQAIIDAGNYFEIGKGFSARGYREAAFEGKMDPFVMADHFRMTAPTFGEHPHAGLSAVSIILEDSVGSFHNVDSLGNNIDLKAGDLYWLSAGRGAIHDEYPLAGADIHGLQIFVNTPKAQKFSAPSSLHIKAEDVPVIEKEGCRVRVVLGESNAHKTQSSPTVPVTILDAYLDAGAVFNHELKQDHNLWLLALEGELDIHLGDKRKLLQKDEALAVDPDEIATDLSLKVINRSAEKSHFILLSGQAIKETFVQDGPFVMSTQQEIEQLRADYAAGKLGSISQNA